MPAAKVHELLEEQGVSYEAHEHARVVSAQRLAAEEDVSGWQVAKPVLLKVGDELVMAVVPAAAEVDLHKAGSIFSRDDVRLATEDEFVDHFPDCEVGAEPPFGNLYGVPVILDERLHAQEQMVCRDGSHTGSITLPVADFLRIVQPDVVDVASPPA